MAPFMAQPRPALPRLVAAQPLPALQPLPLPWPTSDFIPVPNPLLASGLLLSILILSSLCFSAYFGSLIWDLMSVFVY